MAGDWIKMRMDLREDPAVYRLARITSLDRLAVVGRLHAFWSWADKHAVDGRVDGASSLDLDDITDFDGFAAALVQVGWLEVGGDYLAIPKHDRHNGESAKERGLKSARQAKWRQGKDATPSTPSSTRPSTRASTREEKRREEQESAEDDSTQETPVLSLPLVDGTKYGIRQSQITAWKQAFPAVDVRQQLSAMDAWLQANPKNRKTPAGVERFIVSWLTRAQDKAPRLVAANQTPWANAK